MITRTFVVLCLIDAAYMAWLGDLLGFCFCGMAACINGLNWIEDLRDRWSHSYDHDPE